jgi:hypothetical protein
VSAISQLGVAVLFIAVVVGAAALVLRARERRFRGAHAELSEMKRRMVSVELSRITHRQWPGPRRVNMLPRRLRRVMSPVQHRVTISTSWPVAMAMSPTSQRPQMRDHRRTAMRMRDLSQTMTVTAMTTTTRMAMTRMTMT